MRILIVALAASIVLAGCSSTTPEPGPVNDAKCFGDDLDGDLIADNCDDDLDDGPRGDIDGDGVLNEFDQCKGHDDHLDADDDGVADGCDETPMPVDEPVNEAPDGNATQPEPACGLTEGMNDTDEDGMSDDCDPDNTDGPAGDTDGDGVRNDADLCEGHDDAYDVDADNIPDGCDDFVDSDGDGVQDADDVCPGADDNYDVEGDGDVLPDCLYVTQKIDGKCLKRTTNIRYGNTVIRFGYDPSYAGSGPTPDSCLVEAGSTWISNSVPNPAVCFTSESDGPTRHRLGYALDAENGPFCPGNATITWLPWVAP